MEDSKLESFTPDFTFAKHERENVSKRSAEGLSGRAAAGSHGGGYAVSVFG